MKLQLTTNSCMRVGKINIVICYVLCNANYYWSRTGWEILIKIAYKFKWFSISFCKLPPETLSSEVNQGKPFGTFFLKTSLKVTIVVIKTLCLSKYDIKWQPVYIPKEVNSRSLRFPGIYACVLHANGWMCRYKSANMSWLVLVPSRCVLLYYIICALVCSWSEGGN